MTPWIFFFYPFKWVFVLSAIPAWPPAPSPQPSDFYKIHLRWNRGVSLKITFYSPHLHLGSSRWQLASQFIMSLSEKGLQRAAEKLSPYFTIETCQWNNQRHWQVARELFLFFFIRLSCMKQADVTDTLILVSGHVYRSPRSLREVTLPPSVSVPRVYPRPLLILSHSSLSAASR